MFSASFSSSICSSDKVEGREEEDEVEFGTGDGTGDEADALELPRAHHLPPQTSHSLLAALAYANRSSSPVKGVACVKSSAFAPTPPPFFPASGSEDGDGDALGEEDAGEEGECRPSTGPKSLSSSARIERVVACGEEVVGG